MYSITKCTVRRTPLCTALLVLHHTWIHKCAMKKFGFNCQLRNEPFLIFIYNFSLLKGAVNAARVCKLHNGVKKNASISSFFRGQRWTKCAMNILRSSLKGGALILSRALTWWGTGDFFKKPPRHFLLLKIYRMSLISTGSISLDSAFKLLAFWIHLSKI